MIMPLIRKRTWNIGVVDEPIQAFLAPGHRPKIRFLDLPLDGGYFADPFGVAHGTTLTILCEAFDYRTWQGTIAAFRVDGDRCAASPVVVLADEHHMSYPYLVEDAGTMYCVPERAEAREVALYAAVEFPARWIKHAVLLTDIQAVDATLFTHDGLWWLAYTDLALGMADNLSLCYAERLRGPWHRHPRNPVKRDIRSARPGGTPFVHDGQLYRPAQDCSATYGGRVVINRVTRLTPDEFAEEFATTVEPDPTGPFPGALHTLAAAGRFTLVDGRCDRFTAPRVTSAVARWRRGRAVRRRERTLRDA
jgi:hypothetical protein